MAIITVSRGSYSKGKEVAEGVAEALGYECISRDILLEASDRFNIPEIKLLHAIHDAPSILDRFSHGTVAYMTYIQAALLEHVRKGNVVYHGLAGHILLKEIEKVLKVRILADPDLRIAVVMEREQVGERDARKMITKIDEERRKWTRRLYGVDPWDPALYDLVVCIDKIKVEGAIRLICEAAPQEAFRLTVQDREKLSDLSLSCKVKSLLLELDHNVTVTSSYGNVLVFTKGDDRKARKLEEKILSMAGRIQGINNIEVRTGEPKLSADA
jgi:cytidylate kinase